MALGLQLKNAREALGLTEDDIAKRTHMMTQMVREIEAEDFHRFSAPVYGKGFIKLYAKTLGLDPAPLVTEFLSIAGNKTQQTFVALETIDTEHGGGITIVTPEGQPQQAKRPVETPVAPTPRHSYPKASSVTMPNPVAPHPLINRTPAPAKPATAQQLDPTQRKPISVASTPVAPTPRVLPREPLTPPSPAPVAIALSIPEKMPAPVVEIEKPRSTADDVHLVDTFKLESEPASSVIPPQPVAQPAEPFKYPIPRPQPQPKAKQKPAPEPTPRKETRYEPRNVEEDEEEDADEDLEEIRAKPERRKRPPRERKPLDPRYAAAVSGTFRSIGHAIASCFTAIARVIAFLATSIVRGTVAAFRLMGSGLAALGHFAVTVKDKVVELTSSDDDEEVRIKRRYFFTGIAVLATVVGIVVIAASSASSPKNKDETISTEQQEIVEDDTAAEQPKLVVADDSATAPLPPVEIVRVFPAPKVFAR